VKTAPVHVAHWGVYVTTPEVSADVATVKIQVKVDADAGAETIVSVKNEIYELGADGGKGKSVAAITVDGLKIAGHQRQRRQP
jgi:beta-galactosidase